MQHHTTDPVIGVATKNEKTESLPSEQIKTQGVAGSQKERFLTRTGIDLDRGGWMGHKLRQSYLSPSAQNLPSDRAR